MKLPDRRIRPAIPASTTLAAGLAALLLYDLHSLLFFAVGVLVELMVLRWVDRGHLARLILIWALPLVLPLLLIHSLLNRSFAVDYWLMGWLPLRLEGARFGAGIALKVLALTAVAALWLSVRREEVVEGLVRLKFPSPILLIALQSTAIMGLVNRRVDAVFLAQRARGIPVGSGTFDRLKSLPSILIPVVVGTLVDAESRVPALVSQGFGSVTIASEPSPPLKLQQGLWIAYPLLLLGGSLGAEWLF